LIKKSTDLNRNWNQWFKSHWFKSANPVPEPYGPQFTPPDHGYGASASRGVPFYAPAFAGTQCAYSRTDGQAELTETVYLLTDSRPEGRPAAE